MPIQLSYSAAQRYLTSPRSYYLHYIVKLRPKELSSALFFGNAIDLALNALLTQKMENQPINIPACKRVFLDAWTIGEVNGKKVELSQPGCIKFSKADLDESLFDSDDNTDLEFRDPSWVSLKKKAFLIIDAYVEQVLPRIREVKFVQREIKMNNDSGDTFIGIVDFCAVFEDGRTIIFDNKTSSIKYAEDATANSEQLATYYEAVQDELKVDGVGYVVIPKKIRKRKLPLVPIEIQVGPVSEALIQNTFRMYDDVLTGIRIGDFPCSRHDPDGCCSAPWGCSYKRFCESNGKDLNGLVVHESRKK